MLRLILIWNINSVSISRYQLLRGGSTKQMLFSGWSMTPFSREIGLVWLVSAHSPGSITVVGERERPDPQPLEGPEHAQAGPDAVSTLHRDEACNLAALVCVDNLWKKRTMRDVIVRLEIQSERMVWSHFGVIVRFVWDRICGDIRRKTNNWDFSILCSLTEQRSAFVPSYLFSLEISIKDILLLVF